MISHKLYTTKYQSQATQFLIPAAMVVALCEKALSCISNAIDARAKDNKSSWCSNLRTVQEIIHLISSTLSAEKENKAVIEARQFYSQLSLYTSALIADKIDPLKSQDLLEAFRITRDTWKNIEQQYTKMSNSAHNIELDGMI